MIRALQVFKPGALDPSGRARLRRARLTSAGQLSDRIINAIAKVITIPLSIRVLGQEHYGVWLTLLSVLAWFAMSDLGLASALTNPLAAAHSGRDEAKTKELISSTAFLLSAVGLGMSLVCAALVLALPLESILGMTDGSFNPQVRVSALAVVVTNVTLLFLRLPDVISLSFQRGYYTSIASIAVQLTTLVGIAGLTILGGNLIGFSLCLMIPATAGRVALWCALRHRFGACVVPSYRCISKRAIGEVWSDGKAFFSGMWAELFVLQTPNIIVARLFGAVQVPLFSITYQIFYSAFTLLNTLATPMWPAYADAKSRGDLTWIRSTHWRIVRESLLLGTGGFLFLAAASRWLIHLWVGDSLLPPPALPWILALLFVQWTWNYAFVVLLTGLGFIRERVQSVWLLGPVNLIVSVLCSKALGITGLATGMLLAMLLSQTWFLLWITRSRARWAFWSSTSPLPAGP